MFYNVSSLSSHSLLQHADLVLLRGKAHVQLGDHPPRGVPYLPLSTPGQQSDLRWGQPPEHPLSADGAYRERATAAGDAQALRAPGARCAPTGQSRGHLHQASVPEPRVLEWNGSPLRSRPLQSGEGCCGEDLWHRTVPPRWGWCSRLGWSHRAVVCEPNFQAEWTWSHAFLFCSFCLSPLALQLYQEGQFPAPDPTVTLCFGEEFHDLSTAKSKLIIVQVRIDVKLGRGLPCCGGNVPLNNYLVAVTINARDCITFSPLVIPFGRSLQCTASSYWRQRMTCAAMAFPSTPPVSATTWLSLPRLKDWPPSTVRARRGASSFFSLGGSLCFSEH